MPKIKVFKQPVYVPGYGKINQGAPAKGAALAAVEKEMKKVDSDASRFIEEVEDKKASKKDA